jgi:glutathione reductase (NADPH)
MEVDAIMFATGRAPNTKGLGLEQVGIETDNNGAVKINQGLQTSVENVYAVGDVTDHVQLTPVAIKEGMAFADTVYGGKPWHMSYQAIPTAVFSQPPVGTVGLSEEEARAKGGDVEIYKSTFKPMRHTLSGRDEKTLMKLIVDKTTDVVLGAHMVGPDAAEIIQGIGIAVRLGATKAQFDQTVAVHPSAAEEFVTMRFPVGG